MLTFKSAHQLSYVSSLHQLSLNFKKKKPNCRSCHRVVQSCRAELLNIYKAMSSIPAQSQSKKQKQKSLHISFCKSFALGFWKLLDIEIQSILKQHGRYCGSSGKWRAWLCVFYQKRQRSLKQS